MATRIVAHAGFFAFHLDVSAAGQLVMREVLDAYVKRLEREDLVVVRLYPFTRAREMDGPKFA